MHKVKKDERNATQQCSIDEQMPDSKKVKIILTTCQVLRITHHLLSYGQ